MGRTSNRKSAGVTTGASFQTPRKVCVTEEEDGMWILEGDRVRGPKNPWQLMEPQQQQQQQQQQPVEMD